MKIMRSNYDKAHRCPASSGPAFKYNKVDTCNGGSFAKEFYIEQYWYNKNPYWRFHKCRTCGTVVLPSNFRYFDPVWWKYAVQRKLSNLQFEVMYRWNNWRYERELDKQGKGKVG